MLNEIYTNKSFYGNFTWNSESISCDYSMYFVINPLLTYCTSRGYFWLNPTSQLYASFWKLWICKNNQTKQQTPPPPSYRKMHIIRLLVDMSVTNFWVSKFGALQIWKVCIYQAGGKWNTNFEKVCSLVLASGVIWCCNAAPCILEG